MPSLFLNSSVIQSMTRLVEVVAAKMRVAVGRLDLDHALADLENRDVERAAAKVVDGNRLVFLLVEAVGKRRRRRLVDDAHHFEPGDLSGVFRRLALRVVEVRRNGDDGLGDRLAEIFFGGLLQLLQNHRGDFRRRVVLATGRDSHIAVRQRGRRDTAPSSSLRSLHRTGVP